MLSPGTQIGDWIVQKKLADSEDGTLFQAHNQSSSKLVAALRVLPAEQLGRPLEECTEMLDRLTQVHHPALAKVIAGGGSKAGDCIFLVREFIEGEHLGETLGKGPVPWPEASGIVLQLLEGIAFLHKNGIPHGNIKASNVCVRADGTARLLDCSLAVNTAPKSLTEMGHRFGTMAYLPPEVLRGEALDPFRGDVYAMGQLLCELIRGAPLFPDSTSLSATQRQSRTLSMKLEAGPLSTGADIPESLEDLIGCATNPDPACRTVSIEAFERSLREVVHQKNAEEQAEEEFLDVSQVTAPAPDAPKSKTTLLWVVVGLCTASLGFFYVFG